MRIGGKDGNELTIEYWETYKKLSVFDRALCALGICDQDYLVFTQLPADSELRKVLGKTKCFGASDL